MGGMIETLRNAWKIPDLRKKILFTIAMLLVFRVGSHIPVPFLDAAKFAAIINQGGSLLGMFDIVTGGALKLATIFAMSITPYVNASIIMQLLTVAIPRLEQLAKEGEEGRKIIGQYIRYGTVVLGAIQAIGLYFGMRSSLTDGGTVISFVTVVLTFTAGTAFLMWLGEQITEKGIGNGISLMIFAGIVSRGPSGAVALVNLFQATKVSAGTVGAVGTIIGILVMLLLLLACGNLD